MPLYRDFAPTVSALLSAPVNYTAGSLTSASVDVVLPAGAYALIFGSGRFGATSAGWGSLANVGSSPYGTNTMLIGNTSTDTWAAWQNGNYYFVAGDPVPEPSTLFLTLPGIALIACIRRRSRTTPVDKHPLGATIANTADPHASEGDCGPPRATIPVPLTSRR
ncbi:MAG: PEP-CTERM sorting domain-containing protein [Acidobacteria bacterium]|nr:PEP-CTERM sorting domain-containing protein [Acidobacteriota bacterium]